MPDNYTEVDCRARVSLIEEQKFAAPEFVQGEPEVNSTEFWQEFDKSRNVREVLLSWLKPSEAKNQEFLDILEGVLPGDEFKILIDTIHTMYEGKEF